MFVKLILIPILSWHLLSICRGDIPELSAVNIEYDETSEEVILCGDAELSSESGLVKADNIRFNRENFDTNASGNVRINTKDLRYVGESIQYNLAEETVCSGPFRAGNPPINISATGIAGTLNDLNITEPTVIIGEPDCLSPNFTAQKAKLLNAHNDCIPTKIVAHNIFFKIGKFPFFYLPYLAQTTHEIPFSITSDYGNSKEYGFYLRNTILFQLTSYMKMGMLLDFYKDRGVLAGPALQYDTVFDCKRIRGELQSGFIHDRGNKEQLGVDSLDRRTPRNRHFIEWYHQQDITECFQITSQLRQWSDSNSLRDFRPKLFNNNNDPDNFAEAVYSGKNYYITAFTRYSPNNFQNVPQRLPELNFNLVPTRIGCTPVFQTINARIAHLDEKNPFTKNKHHKHIKHCHKHQRSDRMDIFYGLHAPYTIGDDLLTFTPLIGGQVDEYFKKSISRGQFTRLRAQVGFDLQLNSYAQWDCHNRLWNINGLRHILRPIAQYRFIPEHHTGKGPVPQIDRHVFTTNIHPIDLNYLRDIDDARKRNIVRIGLENILQTRNLPYGSRDLAYLNIYQDYLIKKEPFHNDHFKCNDKKKNKHKAHHQHWSDLYSELGISPAYWIGFNLYNRLDVSHGRISELNTSLTLTDARFWSLTYTTGFLHARHDPRKNRHQHFLKPMWRITPRTYLAAEARYDHKLHRITEATYAINNQFSNAWGAELQLIHRSHAVRESKWEVSLVFILLPFNSRLVPIPLL